MLPAPQSALTRENDTLSQVRSSPWVASAIAPQAGRPSWYSKFRWALVGVDLAAISVAVLVTFQALFTPGEQVLGVAELSYAMLSPILVGLWVLILGADESRAQRVVGAGLTEYRLVISASVFLFGALAMTSFWLRAELSRAMFVTTLPIGISLLLVGRWLARTWLQRIRSTGRAMSPALIIGNGDAALDVVKEMRRNTAAGYKPAAVCVVDATEHHVAAQSPGVRVLTLGDMNRALRSSRYSSVIITDGLTRAQSRDLAWRLENRPVQLMYVPRMMDVSGPRLKVSSVEGLSLVHVELPRFTGWKLVVKRSFDIAVSAIALVVLAPLFALVAVLIKLDDRGPILFRQQRVGRYGAPFTIHKFRTMCVDAEDKIDALIAASGGTALLFKLEDDPRITRIGRFLRKYSLDELPQFWSALRGGMSVVGPRPQVPREVAEYTDAHHRRLLIKPGITGLWQVNGRSELSMEESIRLDLRYVENWSLIGDITIIMKTVRVVTRPAGAY